MVRNSPKPAQIATKKRKPGEIRDAIISVLQDYPGGLRLKSIQEKVRAKIGDVPPSSIRSYLRLNTDELFLQEERATYQLKIFEGISSPSAEITTKHFPCISFKSSKLYKADCLDWLSSQIPNSFHAVVTDPPYGIAEYSEEQQEKLRSGKGGIWRVPPSFDGTKRSPLPRFTVLTQEDLKSLENFFFIWATKLLPVLVPGSNVIVASNPLLSYLVASAITRAGFERRGEIIRLVMTMRGGDRPKDAHTEFNEVSVMPRSMWEPWLVFRKPLDGRVQDNLRKWKTGGFRRPSSERPFGDVIPSSPTRKIERELAPHPSLKPQAFLRQVVKASLPLGEGIILDPFAGSGSTLAAAENVGYKCVGVERDEIYFRMAEKSIPKLIKVNSNLVDPALS